MYDVAIIGAGVVGATTTRLLSSYKLKVCIIEKENDVSMGATKANSAIIHVSFDTKPNTLKAKLNVRSAQMMKKITDEVCVKYKNNGSLVIGFSTSDRKHIEELYTKGVKNGVKNLKILEKRAFFIRTQSTRKCNGQWCRFKA